MWPRRGERAARSASGGSRRGGRCSAPGRWSGRWPSPGNDRPGVMLAGAVRAYLNRWAVAPRRAAVFTANDDGWRTAADLAAAGVEVAALVDARRDVALPAGPWRGFAGAEVVGAHGRRGLRAVSVRRGGPGRAAGGRLPGGGGRMEPDAAPDLRTSARGRSGTRRSPPSCRRPGRCRGWRSAGAAAGAFSTQAALAGGAAAAAAALAELGIPPRPPRCRRRRTRPCAQAALWQVAGGRGRAWLDFQNDVTVKDVALAAREGFRSVEHMKRYTTLGMATDQGKTGGVAGLGVLAELTGRGVAETGTTTFRPPFMPVPIAALGAGGAGEGLAPQRFPPAHDAIAAMGGAAGRGRASGYRPGWFPAPGETDWREGCAREVGDGAERGRRLRRHHARQDRRAGAGRGGASSTGSTPTPSRRWRSGGCATGSCCARTASSWTTAPWRGSASAHYLVTTTTAAAERGDGASRVLPAVPLAGARRAGRLGDRAVGAGGGGRAAVAASC